MNALFSGTETFAAGVTAHPVPTGRWRWCAGSLLALMLAACGGGGGDPSVAAGGTGSVATSAQGAPQVASAATAMTQGGSGQVAPVQASDPSATLDPQNGRAKDESGSASGNASGKKAHGPGPTLVGSAVTMVNSTTAGNQSLQAIGALAEGGYTVAWLSGTTLYTQAFNSAGSQSGAETAIALVIDPRDTAAQVLAASSVAVLGDGSVVVAYAVRRGNVDPNNPNVFQNAVYIQRFDASGAQTLPATQVVSMLDPDPRRPTTLGSVQVQPLADGGYVVGWASTSVSATVGARNAFFTQVFDEQNQPVGGVVNVGATINATQFRIVADANGGYTVYWSGMKEDFSPTGLMVTHYDASGAATPILSAWPGNALVLPLGDGGYVLYTSDTAGGVFRQFLDNTGAVTGDKTPVTAMPVDARLLADGSYVVFWTAIYGGMTAQRYDAKGTPIGDLLTLQTSGTTRLLAALADIGFAVAWNSPAGEPDVDVFTQQFVEAPSTTRKACLNQAKGLRGHERQAFMRACLG